MPGESETFDYEAFDREYPRYFEYDGLPAYRDAHGFMVVTAAGEHPPESLEKWFEKATPVSKDEFERLKGELAKG